ncbi:MAG TPA: biosynthetic peptidoglycan transglycosylase, partial [Solirubrobacterales bacterium]|nr:biosynthetic peptidoglycan transglycosylase [Solirubrobacterales bacterium]
MTQRTRRRQRRRGGVGAKLLLVLGGVVIVLGVAAIAVTSWVLGVAAKAPSLASCRPAERGGNTVLYAADGTPLGRVVSPQAHLPVSIRRIPKALQLATVAIEDQRFYEHGGLDTEGILRAMVKDLEAGEAVEGGSTITQQLVRNLCIRHPQRTLERKIVEAKLALEYAKRHSRREILGSYLNVASYGTVEGSTAVGVGAAAKIFFSKPVWKLDLPQAALLAGLPQAPSEYNPLLNPAAAKERRNQVLCHMEKLGYVSPERARAAMASGLQLDLSDGY